MAKKYLLYIHDERFNNEEHKSRLVNKLLAQHYLPNIKQNKDGTISPKDPTKPSRFTTGLEKSLAQKGVDTSIVGTVPVATSRFDKGVCKVHGLPLDDRGRCLQKGCKYS